ALAQRTFAQIFDGLPTRDDVGYFPTYSKEIADNPTSSPEAMETAKELRQHFNTYISQVDAKLAQAYQDAALGSREFYMRLLEMTAVACHDIAALVYENTQPGLRQEGQSLEQRLALLGGRPTDFMHEDYYYFQQYPKGVLDVVGYWAEYHLFGGVVLFDRGESGTEASNCNRAFLHPVGGFRIFQISESQIQRFAEYVQQVSDETAQDIKPPFPLSAEKYTYRVDPFDAMALNIYRDRYERVIPRDRPTRCAQRLADFPELQDTMVQINRGDSSQ
ncbi:hypothetical protein V8E51_012722, partial [Hyaloscypha variabilis]